MKLTTEQTITEVGLMTVEQYVEWLSSLPFADYLVPLNGFMAPDTRTAKAPIKGFSWKNMTVVGAFTNDFAVSHLRSGGWLGIRPKRGYIIVDIDDPEAKEAVLRVYGAETFAVTTSRGVHLYYKTSFRPPSGRENAVFSRTDYIDDEHYIVAPYSDENRIWNGVEHISDIPVEFLVPPPAELTKLRQSGREIYHLEEGDGRNNILFSIGRKIRLWLETHGAENVDVLVEKALHRIGGLFRDPLPDKEVDGVISSVMRTPHRMDYEDNGLKKTGGFSDYEDDVMPLEENPFAQLAPLTQVAQSKPKRSWFMHGLCRRGDVVLLAGAPKSGKSSLVRSIAVSATAHHKQPLPTERGAVLWYMFEEHPQDVLELMDNAHASFPHNRDDIYVCAVDTSSVRNPLAHWIAGLKQALKSAHEDGKDVVAVFVDVVGRLFGQVDINDYATVQHLIERIRWAIRDIPNPPAVFLVHHTNKGTQHGITPLGSQAFMGSCDVVMMIENEDGTTNMKVSGRGVAAAFNMRTTPLQYDANTALYIGIGSDVPAALCELVQLIHSGSIHTLEQANKYQGGVFKLDIRRLLRRGVLICPDGVNLSTNPYSKELEKYLFTSAHDVYNIHENIQKEEVDDSVDYNGADSQGSAGETNSVGGAAVSHSGLFSGVGVDCVAQHEDCCSETRTACTTDAAEQDTATEPCEAAGGCDTGAWNNGSVDVTSGGGEEVGVPHGQRDVGVLPEQEGLSDNEAVYPQRFHYSGGGVDIGRGDDAETITTAGERPDVTPEGDTGGQRSVSDKLLLWVPIDENEVRKAGIPSKMRVTPPDTWKLLRQYTHPPSLQKLAIYFYLMMDGDGYLKPSDFDPFCEDELIDYSGLVTDFFTELKQTHGTEYLSTLEPEVAIAQIFQKEWEEREVTLQEAISLHSHVMKALGKEHRFFLFKHKAFPMPMLAMVFRQKIALVPLKDSEAEGGYPDWRKVYASYMAGTLNKRVYKINDIGYRVLKGGYYFSLYETEKGERVYVLEKKRVVINDEEEFKTHLRHVFALA